MKNNLTVNSSIKEMAKELWKMKITFRQAQLLSYSVSTPYLERRDELARVEKICNECYKKKKKFETDSKTKEGRIRQLKKLIKEGRELNHYFYPFSKYNWVMTKKEKQIVAKHNKRVRDWWKK